MDGIADGGGRKYRFHGKAENCGIDSDAQHKTGNGYKGECGIPAEGAQPMAQILPQVLQPASATRIPAFFSHLLGTAKGKAGLAFGFVGSVTLGVSTKTYQD
jgi:hypothetical protein